MVAGARELSRSSFYKALIPFIRAPSLSLITSRSLHWVIPSPLEVGISTYDCGRGCRTPFQDGAFTWLANWCRLLAGELHSSHMNLPLGAAWVSSWHGSPRFTQVRLHFFSLHRSLQSVLSQGGRSHKLMFSWGLKAWQWACKEGGRVAKKSNAFNLG